MLDREKIRAEIKPLLFSHMAKNARGIYIYFIDGIPVGKNAFGSSVDAKPFEGKVIEVTDEVVVVNPKRNTFNIVDKSLMTEIPNVGDKVEIIPYFRKEFNGQRMGEPVKEATQYMDGLFLNENSSILGEGIVRIPGPEVKNQQLKDLIEYLQRNTLSDGHRKITHLMADVGAKNFIVVDPVEEDGEIGEQLPSLKFSVNSTKFAGDVQIVYHYDSDTFSMGFYDSEVNIIENLYFDDLAPTMEEHLDNDLWQQITVKVISKAKRKAS